MLVLSGNLRSWNFLEGVDREPLRRSLHPSVWSDGSRVVEEVSNFECAGAGVFARVSGEAWFLRECGHLDFLRLVGHVVLCLVHCRRCSRRR